MSSSQSTNPSPDGTNNTVTRNADHQSTPALSTWEGPPPTRRFWEAFSINTSDSSTPAPDLAKCTEEILRLTNLLSAPEFTPPDRLQEITSLVDRAFQNGVLQLNNTVANNPVDQSSNTALPIHEESQSSTTRDSSN